MYITTDGKLQLDKDFCYERMYNKDSYYNGLFFTAVLTTKIYCLPSCTAKKPLIKNTIFYRTIKEAEDDGFRACKICEPDKYTKQDKEKKILPKKFIIEQQDNYIMLQLPEKHNISHIFSYFSRDKKGINEKVEKHRIKKLITLSCAKITLLEMDFSNKGFVKCSTPFIKNMAEQQLHDISTISIKLLGLNHHRVSFEKRVSKDFIINKLIGNRAGLSLVQNESYFEAVVWAILGQQINISYASTLRSSLIETFGEKDINSGMYAHPTAKKISMLKEEDLISLKMSRNKANYLIEISKKIYTKELDFQKLEKLKPEEIYNTLLSIKGIGPWSAAYIMLRGFALDHCIPLGDTGLLEGVKIFFNLKERPNNKLLQEIMDYFYPHGTLATAHFWAYLYEQRK